MYGMSIYQAPQVPQPAFTFGDERLVDPWAVTTLQNTCNNLQVQNMALQQENAALKNKSQSLQQQRENPLCKAANRAYLREFTAYKTTGDHLFHSGVCRRFCKILESKRSAEICHRQHGSLKVFR